MHRIPSLAVAAAALAALFGAAPVAAAAPAAPSSPASYSCSPGDLCIYSGWNGGGARCQWADARRANTADDCPFIQTGQKVRSLWNGTGHRVQYYTGTNYHSRVGSTHAGSGGNLQGSYQIRSFQPQ